MLQFSEFYVTLSIKSIIYYLRSRYVRDKGLPFFIEVKHSNSTILEHANFSLSLDFGVSCRSVYRKLVLSQRFESFGSSYTN